MKLKCVQEGDYIQIGTCAAVPHHVFDKKFERDDQMKDMKWYHNTVSSLEQINSVDQDLTVKAELGTSVADIMASADPLINELNKGFSVEI